MDEIITFNQLTEDHFRGIAKIMLKELSDCLTDRGLTVSWSGDVVEYLVKKAYSTVYGARNLRRTIQRDLEDPISEHIIASFESPISAIDVSVAENKILIHTK